MKKTLAIVLAVVMLLGTLGTTALAVAPETVTSGAFSVSNVVEKLAFGDGTPCYYCEDYATITLNENAVDFGIFYYNDSIGNWDNLGLLDAMDYAPIFDVSNLRVAITETGETVSCDEYVSGMASGRYDGSTDVMFVAGSTIHAMAALVYCVEMCNEDGTVSECYFAADNTDGVITTPPATTTEPTVEVRTGTAATSPCNVVVNGETVAFDAYLINENNYFKLRDLADAVNGSGKQFEVTWDSELSAINMLSNQPYTAVGGELVVGDGTDKEYVTSTFAMYIDGQAVTFEAYLIGENNYFKLRDVCEAFDIGVTWDQASQTVAIDTTVGYVAD